MYDKSDAEIRWLCDVHFLFMCKDTYTCLTPKFEWKKEVPIGEIQLVTPQSDESLPLMNITEKSLDKEQNALNIQEIKEEIPEEPIAPTEAAVPGNVLENLEEQLRLVPIPLLPELNVDLLDATQNLLVSLPLDNEPELMDTMAGPSQEQDQDNDLAEYAARAFASLLDTVCINPCSILLNDISDQLSDGCLFIPPSVPLEPNIVHQNKDEDGYTLRTRQSSNKQTNRPKHKASKHTSYKLPDATTDEEDKCQDTGEATKSELSGYRLASHRYMLVEKRGLISGPAVHTRALKITKLEQETSADSERD